MSDFFRAVGRVTAERELARRMSRPDARLRRRAFAIGGGEPDVDRPRAFALRLGGKLVVTDPVWSRAPSGVQAPGSAGRGARAMPPVDVVVVSHNTATTMDLPTLARSSKAAVHRAARHGAARREDHGAASSSSIVADAHGGRARRHADAGAALVEPILWDRTTAVGRLRLPGT